MNFQKNDIVTVIIEDMSADGLGIGKTEGFTLFVKDAVTGDTVRARIVKNKKTYAYARTEKVVTPSPFRVEPECVFHRQCGGCQLQALSYEKQLAYKQEKIRSSLIRIGGFSSAYIDARMEPIVGMEEPFRYRNKAQYPVGIDREGNLVAGFYAGRTHNIVANTDCLLGAEENREILEIILGHLKKYRIRPYDETTGKGLVRHILIRKGFSSGEIMVCLVLNFTQDSTGKKTTNMSYSAGKGSAKKDGHLKKDGVFLPEQGELLGKLAAVKGMTSVSVNINTERTNVIMGDEVYTIWGSPTISDTIHVRDMSRPGFPFTGRELTFHISPLSFYQVNPIQTEKLYSLALEYAGLSGRETVWDLYCGIGTISLFLAGWAKRVFGVEIVPQAIKDARENARRNGIANAEFFTGKAEEILPEFYAQKSGISGSCTERGFRAGFSAAGDGAAEKGAGEMGHVITRDEEFLHPDVIVVDPPRKGCDEACLDTMLRMGPERIVYVSCDPATMARDLKILCEGGYEIKRVRGVDQFGMTVHVETVCLLSKLNVKQHIEVELTMDEMDLTAAEKKASYEEIKAYVLEKFGIKVSHLYIAQVKRKCGIIERENYNKPKSEDSRQPQCPPEKEAAIRAALEYFKMI